MSFEEREFDEMLHKAYPYLLFCCEKERENIVSFLRALFASIYSPANFRATYDELKKYLDNIKLDSERAYSVKSFQNQYCSLDERVRNMEKELGIPKRK